MLSKLTDFPGWTPRLPDGKRILVVGASGGIGRALIEMLGKNNIMIGAHYATNLTELKRIEIENASIQYLQKQIYSDFDCEEVVDEFAKSAGGLDGIVVLVGGIKKSAHFMQLTSEEWEHDIFLNLSVPFYLSRASIRKMKEAGNGGRIILNGTESALHGGSYLSFPYGISKAGTECMVKGLAREGAKDSILVNGIRLGFIASGFHERWNKKGPKELRERAELVPLKRGGMPEEVAALIIYLLSDWSKFITGQMFAITGGDWL
ncbi:MAG: SDR family oxidoreductase [Deltaproteobacteria bacterium]|nr:SDR family oxidoreductase [Deltaproteobacteria bacterium]